MKRTYNIRKHLIASPSKLVFYKHFIMYANCMILLSMRLCKIKKYTIFGPHRVQQMSSVCRNSCPTNWRCKLAQHRFMLREGGVCVWWGGGGNQTRDCSSNQGEYFTPWANKLGVEISISKDQNWSNNVKSSSSVLLVDASFHFPKARVK